MLNCWFKKKCTHARTHTHAPKGTMQDNLFQLICIGFLTTPAKLCCRPRPCAVLPSRITLQVTPPDNCAASELRAGLSELRQKDTRALQLQPANHAGSSSESIQPLYDPRLRCVSIITDRKTLRHGSGKVQEYQSWLTSTTPLTAHLTEVWRSFVLKE